MIQLSSALLEPPAPAPTASEPPGSPPGAPFSTVLDDHQARTAIAEGHQSKRQDRDGDDGGKRDDDDARTHDDTQPATVSSASLAALLGGVPLPASVATAVVARLPLGAATPPPATGSAPAPGLPGAPAGAATPMPTGPSVPAAASALPLGPGVTAGAGNATATASAAGAQASAGLPATAAASDGAPAQLPAAAAAVADQLQAVATPATKPGVPASGPAANVATAAAATAPAAAAGARSGGAGSGSADQAPSQSTQQPAATAPTATPPAIATQASAQLASADATPGVGLEHAVETVRLALRAAADRGVTHARISLTPRELGGIEVHLRQTADGLVARVVAEHATAAQLLQHAGGDLRRSLEAQGLNLLRLDIGASGEQGGRAGDRRALADAGADGTNNGAGSRRTDPDDPLAALDGAADPTSTTTTLALSNGALVDVLA